MTSIILTITGIPVISAGIGWFTNWLAVKMIFRPRKPIRIAFITFHGLIPKRKSELAKKIGETVEKELISHQDIHKIVTSDQFREQILDAVMERIERFITEYLGTSRMMALILSGEPALRIKESIRKELSTSLPGILEELFEKVESKLDFKEIIRAKIEAFDLGKFETIIQSIAAREMRGIEVLGGILGFIIGLGQALLMIIMNPDYF
jgi:uncharacterized membrane protein YheB (UPF0754 family)